MLEDLLDVGIGVLDERHWQAGLGDGQRPQPLAVDGHTVTDGFMLAQWQAQAVANHLAKRFTKT